MSYYWSIGLHDIMDFKDQVIRSKTGSSNMLSNSAEPLWTPQGLFIGLIQALGKL